MSLPRALLVPCTEEPRWLQATELDISANIGGHDAYHTVLSVSCPELYLYSQSSGQTRIPSMSQASLLSIHQQAHAPSHLSELHFCSPSLLLQLLKLLASASWILSLCCRAMARTCQPPFSQSLQLVALQRQPPEMVSAPSSVAPQALTTTSSLAPKLWLISPMHRTGTALFSRRLIWVYQ